MKLLRLAFQSARNRKTSLLLAATSIAISIMLLLSVDTIRKQSKSSFTNTIAKTDLIVGARSGPVNLLLYSVFRLGNATNNVRWSSYQEITALPEVKWSIPISLGDSHRGFRVMGTTTDYFEHYHYADGRSIQLQSGQRFNDLYDAVIGSEVAKKLQYSLGDSIIISHGLVATGFSDHKDKPFRIAGILKPTGTPVDSTVHVSLAAIEAIHVGWESGAPTLGLNPKIQARLSDLEPQSITAFMLGLHSRIETFRLQRKINNYRKEPLQAILPGATLATLWATLGHVEALLLVISALVLLAGLIGMLTTLLSTLNERRREMAILRTIGAHAYQIIQLYVFEAVFVVLLGCLLGVGLYYILIWGTAAVLLDQYGLHLQLMPLDLQQTGVLAIAVLLGVFLSLIPGLIAYKRALHDGLQLKV